ncbi:MAG: PilZ domain-containing protein [Gammaproteobacteria bacterium]|nr:PilZ domain-containing protein [Gammaproteobacteria bacterium]
MKKKFLNIPLRSDDTPNLMEVSESAIKGWIKALPRLDFAASCQQMVVLLRDINRHQLELPVRIMVMSLLSARVEKLHRIIPRNYESQLLPLSEKQLVLKMQAQELFVECAIGHKIIVSDLIDNRELLTQNKKVLFFSIVKAMHYMSLGLIERFLVYQSPDKGTWLDFHKLFVISEQMGILDITISGNAARGEESTSINELYKKVLLLSLADMSRLMMGEAERVYKQLAAWSRLTALSKLDDSFREGVIVDPGIDEPASHVFSEKPIKFLNGRLFNLERLLEHLDGQIDVLTEQSMEGKNMLGARAEQAMYIRLRFTWGVRSERDAVREPINIAIKLISGLHDCHRGLSHKRHFNPEHDELRFDTEWNDGGDTSGVLALVPEEASPWEKDVIEARAKANLDGHRISQFDENSRKDAWEKVYSTSAIEQARQENTALQVIDCIQVDISTDGMAITCDSGQSEASLAVGKVVAISVNDVQPPQWQTGVVRWLVMLPDHDIRCGVQILSDHAETIAARSIKGAGEEGEYYRSILIPEEAGSPASVLVPAAIFSLNTILSVVTISELKYFKLKELVNNSASYNQFSFDEVEKPSMGINLKAKIDRNRRSF